MLKKGRLRTMYGPAVCDELVPVAHSMPSMSIVDDSNDVWLDKLTSVQSIDPGEAQPLRNGRRDRVSNDDRRQACASCA